jgi:hypothetical protein
MGLALRGPSETGSASRRTSPRRQRGSIIQALRLRPNIGQSTDQGLTLFTTPYSRSFVPEPRPRISATAVLLRIVAAATALITVVVGAVGMRFWLFG